MNKRVQWLKQQKARRTEAELVEAEERAVSSRRKTVVASWLAAGLASIGSAVTYIAHDRHPAVGLTIAAGLWMSALHITDLMAEREVPRVLRWGIYAFAAVASVILIVSLIHHG